MVQKTWKMNVWMYCRPVTVNVEIFAVDLFGDFHGWKKNAKLNPLLKFIPTICTKGKVKKAKLNPCEYSQNSKTPNLIPANISVSTVLQYNIPW